MGKVVEKKEDGKKGEGEERAKQQSMTLNFAPHCEGCKMHVVNLLEKDKIPGFQAEVGKILKPTGGLKVYTILGEGFPDVFKEGIKTFAKHNINTTLTLVEPKMDEKKKTGSNGGGEKTTKKEAEGNKDGGGEKKKEGAATAGGDKKPSQPAKQLRKPFDRRDYGVPPDKLANTASNQQLQFLHPATITSTYPGQTLLNQILPMLPDSTCSLM